MFGEDALWYAKRGTARAWLGHGAQARLDFQKALAFEGRLWVHGRVHYELGRLDLEGRQPGGRQRTFANGGPSL